MMITRKHNILRTIFAPALLVLGMGAQQAAAAPDLSAPGSFYVDLMTDGSNHDALSNGWIFQDRPDFGVLENDDWIRGNPGDNPGFFTMTIPGLNPGAMYDVALLYVDQGAGPGGFKDAMIGVDPDPDNLIVLNGTNETSTLTENAAHANWFQFQSDPGIVGTTTVAGDGTVTLYFDHPPSKPETFLDGVVLTPLIPPLPLQLRVSYDGTDLIIEWDSSDGSLYNLRSDTDPATNSDPATWPIFDGHQDLAATPPENTLSFSFPADDSRYFVVEEFPAPPVSLVSDDFESGEGDWTTGSDGLGGTAWELGAPSNVGPNSANSPTNCFGTNLAAEYDFDADVWLRSPPIDLTNAAGATLHYFQYFEIEVDFDLGKVSVVDAGNNSELAVLVPVVDGSSAGWEEVSMPLPATALGKTVKIEFRLDSDDVENRAGWYIDDFDLTVP